MKLRTRLIIAFLFLAVLPLTLITLYSYRSSIRTFRNAVEDESSALAEDMENRMRSLRRDLALRVERMGRLPLRDLMALGDENVDKVLPRSSPVMAELLAEIGDAAPFLDSIEFNRSSSDTASASAPEAPRTRSTSARARRADESGRDLRRLVIHLARPTPTPAGSNETTPLDTGPEGVVMHLRPNLEAEAPAEISGAASTAAGQALADHIRQIEEFRVVLERMSASREPETGATSGATLANAAGVTSAEASRVAGVDPSAAVLSSVVRTDGNAVGTLTARVSSSNVYRNILSRGRRRQGEIAFVIDTHNAIHAINEEDQRTLESLKLPGTPQRSGASEMSPDLEDWVVVTRKDKETNITFGIARAISSPLRDIRTVAVRNLAGGLVMVGLALLGIIPLSNRITRDLAALSQGARNLAQGNLEVRVPVRSRDEIGRLAETFNRMAHDLGENQKHLVERERTRKELELGRRIQEELLPKQPLSAGAIEIRGMSLPAREVGGDFFNYFLLPDDQVAILVGDVSGKGIAAALLMANFQATLHARLQLAADLSELARELDQELAASTPQQVYLTLFMGILKPVEKQLRYVNAGHNPQIALHAGGKIQRLESTGRPIGLLPGGGYAERRVSLLEGDALFLFTDGLVEVSDYAGREFGQARLENLLAEVHTSGAGDILLRVQSEVQKYRGEVEAADDATMMVLKVGPSSL